MKLMVELDEKRFKDLQRIASIQIRRRMLTCEQIIAIGTPLEEIPNPCIECSQNCCVCELNGEKCECQKVYVVKENRNER